MKYEADYNKAVDTRVALKAAYKVLPKGSPERATIGCMLIQMGCEHFEGTKTLTELCDIIMFG